MFVQPVKSTIGNSEQRRARATMPSLLLSPRTMDREQIKSAKEQEWGCSLVFRIQIKNQESVQTYVTGR